MSCTCSSGPSRIITLRGLTSRWMIPMSCAAVSAAASSRDARGARGRQGPFVVDERAQRAAADELLDQKPRAVLEPLELVHRRDVLVIDVLAGDRLALEALDQLGQLLHLGVQDLDRHLGAGHPVTGAEHGREAAHGDQLLEPVAIRDDTADEGRGALLGGIAGRTADDRFVSAHGRILSGGAFFRVVTRGRFVARRRVSGQARGVMRDTGAPRARARSARRYARPSRGTRGSAPLPRAPTAPPSGRPGPLPG